MPNRRPILIVEDDEALREILADHLAGEFAVSVACSLEEADKALNSDDAHFDAVILDIGLPDGDGRDYCARLRRRGHNMPVIMLTGSDGEADVVRGLEIRGQRLHRQAVPLRRIAGTRPLPVAHLRS